MKKLIFIVLAFLSIEKTNAQELFVYTEPASNMPSKSVGIRMSNMLMDEAGTSKINYHVLPEIMVGINKNLMVHAEAFVSNREGNRLVVEGAGIYAKYRFLSKDDVHKHFRMAAFGRLSSNDGDIHQEEIETNGHNSGFELGIIGTQLVNKVAISSSISYERAFDNSKVYYLNGGPNLNAVNYTLSVGKLMLPKEYKSYNQTNLNLMLEMLGQRLPSGKSFLDLAPSVQFIIKSQGRLDIGYRKQLYSTMQRTAPNGFLVRLEWAFFGAWK